MTVAGSLRSRWWASGRRSNCWGVLRGRRLSAAWSAWGMLGCVAAAESVAAVLRPGQLVILESTTYPGTTRELMGPVLEASGLRIGEDLFVCFSPERVDPGNETWQIRNTPKVIGGITGQCLLAGSALYGQVMEHVVTVSSTEAAELTKLLENTFRAVNIALVNEMAQVADRLQVDVFEVIEAAASKPFGFMKFSPGQHWRALHSAGSALPRMEDADAELQNASRRAGQRDQQ
jgi:hypothetical protein